MVKLDVCVIIVTSSGCVHHQRHKRVFVRREIRDGCDAKEGGPDDSLGLMRFHVSKDRPLKREATLVTRVQRLGTNGT